MSTGGVRGVTIKIWEGVGDWMKVVVNVKPDVVYEHGMKWTIFHPTIPRR
jgi:hypothetical protein